MTTDPNSTPVFTPIPPTRPDAFIAPEQPSRWPKVLGIIAIVLGAWGIFGGCTGAFSPLFVGQIGKLMPPGQEQAMLASVKESATWTITFAVIRLLLGALLLFGGIGLLKRRRWCVKAIMAWAPLKTVFEIANGVMAQKVMKAQLEAMQNDPTFAPNMANLPKGFMDVAGTAGLVITIIFGCAFPIFMLIWFARRKIRAEAAQWS